MSRNGSCYITKGEEHKEVIHCLHAKAIQPALNVRCEHEIFPLKLPATQSLLSPPQRQLAMATISSPRPHSPTSSTRMQSPNVTQSPSDTPNSSVRTSLDLPTPA